MQLELALQSWREQKPLYLRQCCQVINLLSQAPSAVPSVQCDIKATELKDMLHNGESINQMSQHFAQVYVHRINNRVNRTLMELVNELRGQFGGELSFWQNQVSDIAQCVQYSPDLSIWQVHSSYDKYEAPEVMAELRKKRLVGKQYLIALTTIIKMIEKCKPEQTDLTRIDEHYKKLKKCQEKYHAFLEEITGKIHGHPHISLKGKQQAKQSLFYFLKNKPVNTLSNYNFTLNSPKRQSKNKILKDDRLVAFQAALNRLNQPNRVNQEEHQQKGKPSIEQLQGQFKHESLRREHHGTETIYVTIFDKDYYFAYYNYPISLLNKEVSFIEPYKCLPFVNYEVNSEDEYDELLAEDLDNSKENEFSEVDSDSINSFVVSDGHQSGEEQENVMKMVISNKDRWIMGKGDAGLEAYKMETLFQMPMPLRESQFDEQLLLKVINNRSRAQFPAILEANEIAISKSKLDEFLKSNFRKIRINKKLLYVAKEKSKSAESEGETHVSQENSRVSNAVAYEGDNQL